MWMRRIDHRPLYLSRSELMNSMATHKNRAKYLALVFGVVLVFALELPVGGQDYRKPAVHSNQPSPLARLQQLSERVRNYTTRGSSHQENYRQLQRSDAQLRKAAHPDEFARRIPFASQTKSYENRGRIAQAGYTQQVDEFQDSWPQEPGWRKEEFVAPPNPVRSIPQDRVARQSDGQYLNNAGNRLPMQGSGSRNETYYQDNTMMQQSGFSTSQYQSGQVYSDYEDPGILGVNSKAREPRFKQFSSRIPASERAILLEDEVERLEKQLKAKQLENRDLQRRLDDKEKLLAEIQISIDDAISQLTLAAETNQLLRDRIKELETENQIQKINSEKLLDEVQGRLRDLLTAELSGGN